METPAEIQPKRRGCLRALKVGCLGIIGLFLLLVIAGTAWFFYVTHDVMNDVVVHDEDLVVTFKNVPDEKNGFFVLQPVLENIESNKVDLSVFQLTNRVPTEEAVAAVSSFNLEHPEYLKAFYGAAEYERYRIPIDESVPLYELTPSRIIPLYKLSCCSLSYIESLMRADRQEEALLCLKSHTRLGQMTLNDAHEVVTGMIGLATTSDACNLLARHLSEGSFGKELRPEIQALVYNLRENSDYSRMVKAEYSIAKAMCANLSEQIDKEKIRRGIPETAKVSRFGRYIYSEPNTLKDFETFYRLLMESCSNPESQLSFQKPSLLSIFFSGNAVGNMLYYISVPSFVGFGDLVLEQKTKVELIRLYLALWEYYGRQGTLPADLESLVPAYLPELPRDPFGRGASLQYDPQKKLISSAGDERSNKGSDLKISLGFVR